MKARRTHQPPLKSYSLRLSAEDVALLKKVWITLALGESKPNLSRAARAIFKKAREL